MREALGQAEIAFEKGEVPIGALIAVGDEIIARAYNRVEELSDSTAHAEILAMRQASQAVKNWRLSSAILCVTLEPCVMCVGALRLARVGKIVYGAGDSRFGALGSVCDLSNQACLGPAPQVIGGIMQEECAELLKRFFKNRREEE